MALKTIVMSVIFPCFQLWARKLLRSKSSIWGEPSCRGGASKRQANLRVPALCWFLAAHGFLGKDGEIISRVASFAR